MSGVFLDRDGVIIKKAADGDYIKSVNEVEFLPGSPEAIVELGRSGFQVIVVTNQRGIATGRIKLVDLEGIHTRLKQVITSLGGDLCDIYCCPHDIPEDCMCRKPRAGMLLRAAEKYQLKLAECWMVGDTAIDIAAGKSAGCKTALITQSGDFSRWCDQPDICAESLAAAAKLIISIASAKAPTNH